MRGVPAGWVQRAKFFIGCGTNTASAKRLVFASAAVYMPLEPGGTFCCVMPPGACETLTRTACACNAPLQVCLLSARACVMRHRRRKRACAEARGSTPASWAEDLPSWMLGVSDGWLSDHPAKLVGVKLLNEESPLQVAAGRVHHSLVVTIDGPKTWRRSSA
jgi:hypothetical protein